MTSWFKKIDQFLLPASEENRVAPYVWLVYLAIYYVMVFFSPHTTNDLFIAAIGTLAFLAVYFHGYWQCGNKIIVNIVAIALIGSALTVTATGASVFFVYAGAFCCRLGSPKKSFAGLVGLVFWMALMSWVFQLSAFFYIPGIVFTLIVGGVNIYQFEIDKKKKQLNLSQEEIKALAKTAERERIARDLHDLIGHTFSVITLKAELAGKLIDKDLAKAKSEINDLENISRDALKQVREVVTGYRTTDLTTELAHAKYVLESNDINFNYHNQFKEENNKVSKELAIILKELVTNILKHAQATNVKANIVVNNNQILMTVEDDGVGIDKKLERNIDDESSFGLKGITERVSKLGGSFNFNNGEEKNGFISNVIIPTSIS